MIIKQAPANYDARDEQEFREEVRRAHRESLKRGQDIEIVKGRLIITSVSGAVQRQIVMDDLGNLSTVAL